MKRKHRILIWIGLGLAFPLLAYVIYPDWSVFWFTLLVLIIGGFYEWWMYKDGSL